MLTKPVSYPCEKPARGRAAAGCRGRFVVTGAENKQADSRGVNRIAYDVAESLGVLRRTDPDRHMENFLGELDRFAPLWQLQHDDDVGATALGSHPSATGATGATGAASRRQQAATKKARGVARIGGFGSATTAPPLDLEALVPDTIGSPKQLHYRSKLTPRYYLAPATTKRPDDEPLPPFPIGFVSAAQHQHQHGEHAAVEQ